MISEALIYLLDNIYIRFGAKLYRHFVGIPIGTNCVPLVADLFLFCYERYFMTSLSVVKQAEIIEAFKSTSRYLDDLLNIDNPYFEGMVNRIYPPELQLNKANTSDTEAPFLDLHLSISKGFVSSKIYDKRDDFKVKTPVSMSKKIFSASNNQNGFKREIKITAQRLEEVENFKYLGAIISNE